jgi:ribonuclease E
MADLDAGTPAQDPGSNPGTTPAGATDPATASGPASTPSTPSSGDPVPPSAGSSASAGTTDRADADPADRPDTSGDAGDDARPAGQGPRRRRRGSRGGRNRSRPRPTDAGEPGAPAPADGDRTEATTERAAADRGGGDGGDDRDRGGRPGARSGSDADDDGDGAAAGGSAPDELPERSMEGRPRSVEAAERALVRRPSAKPKIGDTMPAPPAPATRGRDREDDEGRGGGEGEGGGRRRRRRGGRGRGGGRGSSTEVGERSREPQARDGGQGGGRGRGRTRSENAPVEAVLPTGPLDLDDEELESRRGRERKGRPVGRYLMAVHVTDKATQIAVLEGRALMEHYVSRPADDIAQIHGNVYLGRVQNVLPGMEAAFVDIGTPKNAVLYRGDVQYDKEDLEPTKNGGKKGEPPRIEDVLRAKQTIICQVTKNPIGAKGARLTQEISLPGRFVVLIPNSATYGISKRLSDDERKRLRAILDRVKPAQHGVIVRTAAEGVTSEEIEADVRRLVRQWDQIESLAKRSKAPALLYREPDMAVRVIREEFNSDYRGVVIDDRALFEEVRAYVGSISPELADRVEYYDPEGQQLPLYEKLHVHEQVHKALDRKVWLPSGGSLIIERTEALTVIDVNTGKNVGRTSLEETVTKNNVEAAEEIAHQLRLRDIGGIIVIDFIDMEVKANRDRVLEVFRNALARDKTRTQVFEISELGLCEMTRKRIGEGLLESFAGRCPDCEGRGLIVDPDLLPTD